MTVQFDWTVADDCDLVGAACAGDRAAFSSIYDRYADRLYDFCVGIVGHHDAADCVQEAFCLAAVDLPTLRDSAKLRPWLYAIARHQALRILRARHRETTSDELPDAPSADAGPDVLAARNELADLVAQAEGGLSDRDREVLNLAYRHGLNGAELAQALSVSNGSAKKMVQRLRETIERSLGALLVARQASSGYNPCPELTTIMAGWDGQFTILVRKRISRHIESCPNCDEERGRLVNPAALLGASPVLIPAPTWLREQTLAQAQLAPVAGSGTAGQGAHALAHVTAHLPAATGKLALWAVAVVGVPAVAWGAMTGLPALSSVSVPPARVAPSTPTTPPSQQPALDSNVPTPQSITAVPPSMVPAQTDNPSANIQGNQPNSQSPAALPSPGAAPHLATATPPTHTAPAASTPPSRVAPPASERQLPPDKHCADGSTVAGGQSCPTPKLPPSAAPAQCPHVAVPSGPICARSAPTDTPPTSAAPARTPLGH